jgi:hypothetical protein
MKRIALFAAAAVLAAPAVFAQSYGGSSSTTTTPPSGAVTSSTGASVSSGTGGVVKPASTSTSASVSAAPMNSPHLLPGGSMVQHSTDTKTLGAAPGPVQTVTPTTYWANVPSGAGRRHDFQRWMSLK